MLCSSSKKSETMVSPGSFWRSSLPLASPNQPLWLRSPDKGNLSQKPFVQGAVALCCQHFSWAHKALWLEVESDGILWTAFLEKLLNPPGRPCQKNQKKPTCQAVSKSLEMFSSWVWQKSKFILSFCFCKAGVDILGLLTHKHPP